MEKQIITALDVSLLAKLVDESGLSRREIAERTGLSLGYVSLLLNGKRNMNITLLNKFSEATNIDLKQTIIEK